MYQMLACH